MVVAVTALIVLNISHYDSYFRILITPILARFALKITAVSKLQYAKQHSSGIPLLKGCDLPQYSIQGLVSKKRSPSP